MKQSRVSKTFYLPVIRAGIMLALLWVLGAILKGLPMLKDLAIANTDLSAATVGGMIVTLLMVAILINFAQELGHQLRHTLRRFPQSGVIAASLVYIVAVVLTYSALTPLGQILFGEDFWIYQVGFLLNVLVPVWMGGSTLYKNTDKLVDLITSGVDQSATRARGDTGGSEDVLCPECGAPNAARAKFCVECGTEITVPEEVTERVVCPSCGAENDGEAKFCFQCGSDLTALRAENQAPQTCQECGTGNEADASYCIACGADLAQ